MCSIQLWLTHWMIRWITLILLYAFHPPLSACNDGKCWVSASTARHHDTPCSGESSRYMSCVVVAGQHQTYLASRMSSGLIIAYEHRTHIWESFYDLSENHLAISPRNVLQYRQETFHRNSLGMFLVIHSVKIGASIWGLFITHGQGLGLRLGSCLGPVLWPTGHVTLLGMLFVTSWQISRRRSENSENKNSQERVRHIKFAIKTRL